MSQLDVSVPHQLSQEEAVKRVKNLLAQVQEEQKNVLDDLTEEWDGNHADFSFNAKGFSLAGTIDVNENDVTIQGDLPFMLSFFKGKIEEVIKNKAAAILS
jgi:hypothetical protein